MHTLTSLISDINGLGVRPGQALNVHSALKQVGHIEGGAETMIRALFSVLGEGGTLLFPNLNIPHEFTAANPPRFDLQLDEVRRQLGVLPQIFKTAHATAFSRHPTHAMMGHGPLCQTLFSNHEAAGIPCGPGTPWWRLADAEGSILLLGVTQQCNTSIHGPEEACADYQLSPEMIDGMVIDRGVEIRVRSRLHLWCNPSEFSRIDPWLQRAGGLRRGKIGDADCLLIDAKIFQNEVCDRLRKNPRFLLRS